MLDFTGLQIKIINALSKSELRKDFYLTGGTLLSALHLHHRLSLDLDFFSNKPVIYEKVHDFVLNLKDGSQITEINEHKIYNRWEFFLHNHEAQRVEFVFYDHKPLKKHGIHMGIMVDSLDDIAANKTMAFLDRNEPKDLFDLYFLITKTNCPVQKLVKLVKKKFDVIINEGLIYSEFHKSYSYLNSMKPLMIEKSEKEKEELIKKIVGYFELQSYRFLNKVLK